MDDAFAREVLRLAHGQTIEDYDKQLRSKAQQLGIPLPPVKLSTTFKQTSLSTRVSQTRSSISVESQASQSTGLTSTHSRASKEHDGFPFHTTSLAEKRRSATSVSIKDYDSILSQTRQNSHRLSLNFSPPITPSPSTFSLPLNSSRESSPRRHIIRGLSRLRLHRRSSSNSSAKHDECPHCPHESSRHQRPSHALPCGHRYCTPALRRVIQTSIQRNNAAPPTCCKRPIPSAMVERVMTQEEQDDLPGKSASWDNETASDHSAYETRTNSETVTELERRPRSSKQKFRPIGALEAGELRQSLNKAMEHSSFRTVWYEQEEQRDRCLELDRNTREILRHDRDAKMDQAARDHEQQKDDLTEKHMQNISQVEDKHVQDEMDLRASQETETRNCATALRHMEAFCRGQSTSGDIHHRVVSDQDRRELAKAQVRSQNMDKKHEDEISVIRGEQTRRMTQRIHRQQLEVQQLEHRQNIELEAIQEQYEGALHNWRMKAERRRERMKEWWHMQVEIWRKDTEREGVLFEHPLPSPEWSDIDDESVERGRRDTLHELPSISGAARGGESKPASPPARQEKGISTTIALRGSSFVGRS